MDALKLISGSGFLFFNMELARATSPAAAIVYAALERESDNIKPDELKQLNGIKYFPVTAERLEELTTFKRRPQDRAIKELSDYGIINIVLIGLPAKRHFAFN